MTDMTPPSDPFAQPPQVDASAANAASPAAGPATSSPAAASAKARPWKLIVGAVVAVAVVIGGVVLFTGGDDDKGSSGGGGDGGNGSTEGEFHLARYVGDENASIEVLDDELAVARTVPLEGEGSPALSLRVGRYLATEADGATVEVLDLAEGGSRVVTLPEGNLALDRGVQAGGSDYAVYFSLSGGSLTLVDLAGASADNMGSSERGYVPSGVRPGFSLFFAMEGGATVVVPHDDPSSWWEVPGPVAFVEGRRTLVLGQVDGEPAIRAFDGEQQQGETIPMKAPQLGGLLTATGAMTIDTGGGLWSIDLTSGEFETLGVLGIGIDAAVPIASDRVMAWGTSGSRVVRADGTITQEIDPVADGNGELQPIVPVSSGIGSKCISVQPGQRPQTANANASTVDLASSERLVAFTGTPYGFSPDGCSAMSMADPTELMLDGALVDLGMDRVLAYSPDLTQVVGVVLGDAPQVYLVDVATGDRRELTQGAYFWAKF